MIEREWKLGADLSVEDNLLDGITFQELITTVRCNCPDVTPDAIREEVDEIIKIRMQDMEYLLENNLEAIAAEVKKERGKRMKIVALLEVDEKTLEETGQSLADMGWVEQSGIRLVDYNEIDASDYEYATFFWNNSNQKYERVGRPAGTANLAMNRGKEFVSVGQYGQDYDADKVIVKRRVVTTFCGVWEDVEIYH